MTQSETATERAGQPGGSVMYVYGVVPADVTPDQEAVGVGDPPRRIGLVHGGEAAALVSEIPAGAPLGTPQDLTAHARVLDSAATEVPVLPLRFGAVLTDAEAVEREFLAPHADAFARALRELEGRVQFVLRGRYDEDAVLGEVMREDPRIAELREQVAGKPADAVRDARIALGELIGRAVQAKREADTRAVALMLDELGYPISIGEPSSEWDAVNVACLVEARRQDGVREAAQRFADEHAGRISVRLLGPMAAYDFVPADARGTS